MRTIITLCCALLAGCGHKSDNAVLDSPTSGSIKIAVDDSLQPLMDAEVKAFTGIYHKASVTVVYVPEATAVQLLLDDSVRLAVITRELTGEEKAGILASKITPQAATVAIEGIAVIVNRSNSDTTWSMAKLKQVLGNNSGDRQRAPKLVFDHNNSGIVRWVRDSLLRHAEFSSNSYALENNQSVIDYVTASRDAVGLIGASWISDRDDSLSNRFLQSIRVVAIGNGNEYYKPYQAYIATGQYPLTRKVVICSREARSGLATGFMSFVAGEKGQRIVLKAGLVPATMPLRIVEINHEPF